MFFNEDHLRITKVRTLDGLSPQIGEDEKPVKKIIQAPLNKDTKKLFDDQNTRLPNSLKMKIEVVKAYKPEPAPVAAPVDVSALEKKIAELEAQNQALIESQQQKVVVESSANGEMKEHEVSATTETKTSQSKNTGNASK